MRAASLPQEGGLRELARAIYQTDSSDDPGSDYQDRIRTAEYVSELISHLWKADGGQVGPGLRAAVAVGRLTQEDARRALGLWETYPGAAALWRYWQETWPELSWVNLHPPYSGDTPSVWPAYQMALANDPLPDLETVQTLIECGRSEYRPPVIRSSDDIYSRMPGVLEAICTSPEWPQYLELVLEAEPAESAIWLITEVIGIVARMDDGHYLTGWQTLCQQRPDTIRRLLRTDGCREDILMVLEIHDDLEMLQTLFDLDCPGLPQWSRVAVGEGAPRCLRRLLQCGQADLGLFNGSVRLPDEAALVWAEHRGQANRDTAEALVRELKRYWDGVLGYLPGPSPPWAVVGTHPDLLLRLVTTLLHSHGVRRKLSEAQTMAEWVEVPLSEFPWDQALAEWGVTLVGRLSGRSRAPDPESLIVWCWRERHRLGLQTETVLTLIIHGGIDLIGLWDDLTPAEVEGYRPYLGDLMAAHPAQVGRLIEWWPEFCLADALASARFRWGLCDRPRSLARFLPIQEWWTYPCLLVAEASEIPPADGEPIFRPFGCALVVGIAEDLPKAVRLDDQVQMLGRPSATSAYRERCLRIAEAACRSRRPRAKSARSCAQ